MNAVVCPTTAINSPDAYSTWNIYRFWLIFQKQIYYTHQSRTITFSTLDTRHCRNAKIYVYIIHMLLKPEAELGFWTPGENITITPYNISISHYNFFFKLNSISSFIYNLEVNELTIVKLFSIIYLSLFFSYFHKLVANDFFLPIIKLLLIFL